MSYYPVKLDKIRNLQYNMRAINLIEKSLGKPMMKIEGMSDGSLTMNEYAVIIWAGLAHEDKDLTPDKVIELIDKHSSLKKISKEMWKALNEVFADDEEIEETEEKNE